MKMVVVITCFLMVDTRSIALVEDIMPLKYQVKATWVRLPVQHTPPLTSYLSRVFHVPTDSLTGKINIATYRVHSRNSRSSAWCCRYHSRRADRPGVSGTTHGKRVNTATMDVYNVPPCTVRCSYCPLRVRPCYTLSVSTAIKLHYVLNEHDI